MVGTRESKKHGIFPVFLEPMKAERYVNKEQSRTRTLLEVYRREP